jgi:hypothetical protein
MLAEVLSIVAPVFICAGIGAVWARSGRSFDIDMTTTLITNVTSPCLVFHTLSTLSIDPRQLATIVGAAVAGLAVAALIAAAVLAAWSLAQRSFLPALIFPNTGNMGLPLNLLAFGDGGLALAIGVFTLYSLSQFTIGVALASGRASLRALARVPIVYALPPALAFMLAGVPPPKWLASTTHLVGTITIPMMLIALGVSLVRLEVRSLGRNLALAALRLVLGFTVGVAVASAWGLDGTARGVLIIQSTMPSAVFNYLFAQRYQTAPSDVASIVVLSTALSMVTLPALLWFVL